MFISCEFCLTLIDFAIVEYDAVYE